MSELNLPVAPLWRRLTAMIYDLLNILGIALLLAVALIMLASAIFNNGDPIGTLPISLTASYFFSVAFFFNMIFWRKKRQTLGMKAWGLVLINERENQPISVAQCVLRVGIGFFSLFLGGLGYWWMLWDKQEKTWHDHASFTRVVYIPKQK